MLLTMFAAISIFAQDNFVSADGGFAIDLPDKITSAEEDIAQDYEEWFSAGKSFKWKKDDNQPSFVVQFAKFEPTTVNFNAPPKRLSLKFKTSNLENFGKAIIEAADKSGSMNKVSLYSFNKNKGKEWYIIKSNSRILARAFFVNNTYYFVAAYFSTIEEEDNVRKILDSFRLLTRQEIIDIKVKLAEPKPLPQSPVSDKPFSDAHDNNLKGKVKLIVQDFQETPKSKRVKSTEFYYNEQGNLTRHVVYDLGRIEYISVWGYIEGNRVNNESFTNIYFDDDPPQLTVSGAAESGATQPKDERYDSKYVYKYNEKQQLIEEKILLNDGRLGSIETHTYKGNERTTIAKQPRFNDIQKTIQIYDENGDLAKETSIDEKGRINYLNLYTYELDTKGNWIVQKSFDNVKIKGKTVLKPSSITYRTITYYD